MPNTDAQNSAQQLQVGVPDVGGSEFFAPFFRAVDHFQTAQYLQIGAPGLGGTDFFHLRRVSDQFAYPVKGDGAMLQKLIKVYEGDAINRVINGFIFVPIEYDGVLKAVHIQANISLGTAIFTARLNGAVLWTGDERISIAGPGTIGSKIDLNIPVEENDKFHIDLVQKPTGIIQPPITVTLEICVENLDLLC